MTNTVKSVLLNTEALEEWRKGKGIKKADLARGLGVCPRTVTRWCKSGKIPFAPFKLLQDILIKNGGDPNALIRGCVRKEKGSVSTELWHTPSTQINP
jgi:DNA-binding transcriptional regulator YiaG